MTTSGGRRDAEELRAGLSAWCESTRPDLAALGIADISHSSTGWSNETIVVGFGPRGDAAPSQRLVIRPAPLRPTFPNPDLELQADVQNALAPLGVPTAAPVVLEQDASWIGAEFLVMPFVEGTIPGEASLFDPWLTEATAAQRRSAQHEMVRIMSRIHTIDWRATGLGARLVGATGGLDEQIRWWDDYLLWARGGRSLPRIEAVLEWCRANRPEHDPPMSLLWGDPRLGNLVMDAQRHATGVLDWELVAIGPAEMDLGWYLGLERMLHELTGMDPLAGFAPPGEVAAEHATAIGRPLHDLGWYQVFAVFRSISINVRQASIAADAGVDYMLPPGEENPLLGVVERWIGQETDR